MKDQGRGIEVLMRILMGLLDNISLKVLLLKLSLTLMLKGFRINLIIDIEKIRVFIPIEFFFVNFANLNINNKVAFVT